jgi:hypothetical protein
MRILRALLLALCASASHAHADTLKADADLKPFGDRVMSAVAGAGLPAAVSVMRPYVVISETELQNALLKMQAQRDQLGPRYGRTTGFEYIGTKRLGQSLVRLTYIERTERHALPWMFHFYRTPNGWVLTSFIANDLSSELFNLLQ